MIDFSLMHGWMVNLYDGVRSVATVGTTSRRKSIETINDYLKLVFYVKNPLYTR
jgi:hypothetical protein